MTSHHSDTTGHEAGQICLNQLDTLPSSGYWCVACGFSLNVFLQGNHWWRHEMSAVFSVWNPSLSSMLESKRRTANNTNKELTSFKIKIFFVLVVPYISCSPEWYFVPREPLAVNSLLIGQISAKICCCEAFSSRTNPSSQPTSDVKGDLRQPEITGISSIVSLSPGLLSRIVASQHPASRASLAEEEKRKLCLNHVKPLRSLHPELLDKTILFCVVKLVFFECEHPSIFKPMVITEAAEASARLKAWVRNYILATCRAWSTKIFLDSCRIFHKYAKMEQGKEMLYWQDDSKQKKGE